MSDDVAKTEIVERMHFILPRSWELLLPAAAMLQHVVDTYDARMLANDVSQGQSVYRLEPSVDVEMSAWNMLERAGYQITKPIAVGSQPEDTTILLDLSDERLEMFADSGKHAAQVCGLLCGEECSPLPKLRQVKASGSALWGLLVDAEKKMLWWDLSWLPGAVWILDVLELKDDECCGIIGCAGWETYVAAAMGLPVVEIYPENMHRGWLSKWTNPLYHMVTGDNKETQLKAAVASIEQAMKKREERVANASV